MRKSSLLPALPVLLLFLAAPAAADPRGEYRSPTGAQVTRASQDGGRRERVNNADFAGARRPAASEEGSMGGGFIEFLFTGRSGSTHTRDLPQPSYQPGARETSPYFQVRREPAEARPRFDPRYERRIVDYQTEEKPGTIVIDTPNKYLYLVQDEGKAIRYGVGVGRPGFEWAGVKQVSQKREWPDWIPPKEMLERRPDLPTFMAGGPDNPLGARAIYLGSSLYRIHGSNEPETIGQAVSSGCIRMRNQDVIDLYEKVKVGTRVIVI
jgi:lipoprotein-anchoring transpeptidase ErfK/SrfK